MAITEDGYKKAAAALGVNVPTVKAVVSVETNGAGNLPDGRPKILFEAHWFSKFTKHKYDSTHPDISSKNWNRSLYKGGSAEYARLDKASKLDKWSALVSTSWGLGQIMGFNHKAAGYANINDFVADMHESEDKQLLAMCRFIGANKGMLAALRKRQWGMFAMMYNGEGYKANKYDEKLASAYNSANNA
jgi:hypothetical protein